MKLTLKIKKYFWAERGETRNKNIYEKCVPVPRPLAAATAVASRSCLMTFSVVTFLFGSFFTNGGGRGPGASTKRKIRL